MMDAEHHDLVLAVTSHVPHLIAYNIVGTVADLERVTEKRSDQVLGRASATSPASPPPIRSCGAIFS